MSSSHNATEMHPSVAGNEYDRSAMAARLQGTVDTTDARSHSSHSGHSDYHPHSHSSHPLAQPLNTANNDPAQHHHHNSVPQQHEQQHSQQHPYGHQYPYPGYPQISSRSNSSGSLTPTASSGIPPHHTQHFSSHPTDGSTHG